tara:strand:- start:253 stop:585 length:333 start_codon:yes stop_codon:yes gene_type:complete
MNNLTNNLQADFSLFIWAAISFFFILTDHRRMKKLTNLIKDKRFLFNLIPIVLFSIVALHFYPKSYDNYDRFIKATKQAIIALIIAVCAAIDLRLAPFYFVWITSYYFDM